MFKDVVSLRAKIREFNLDRLEDEIVKLAKPAVQIHRTKVDDTSIFLGHSKLGGNPDLPADFKWPHDGDKPLTFIAQFKLSDVSPHDKTNLLPSEGILYFFFEADEVPYGQYEDRDGWQIVYLPVEATPLVRTSHPKHQGTYNMIEALPAHRMTFSSKLSLPTVLEDELISPFLTTDDEDEAYYELTENLYPVPRHHLLGYPSLIQGEIENEIVVNNIKSQKNPDMSWYSYLEKNKAYIQSEVTKWQFLFQIDTDYDSLNVMWGDVGTLYVAIPKASLAARKFEDCWTIMQCS